MVFALRFDDLMRKMRPKGVELHKVITVMPGSNDYEAYVGLFCAPENDTLHVQVEDDNATLTFYTIKVIKEKLDDVEELNKKKAEPENVTA